jgi:ComF family protein
VRPALAEAALGRVIDPLLAVVFPSSCPCCAEPLGHPSRGPLCERCWERLAPAPVARCRCGRRLLAAFAHCGRCRRSLEPVAAGLSLGPFEGPLKVAIHELKYHGRRRVARRLAEALLRLPHARPILSRDVVLVPVPLHPRRERERGFNQAERISAALAEWLGLRHEPRALVRRLDTPSQTGLSAAQRRRNLMGAFAVRRRAALSGRPVVLVDDVATTGATARACARALRQAGATEVRLVVAARVD